MGNISSDIWDNKSMLADRCLANLEHGNLTISLGYARALLNQCVKTNKNSKDRRDKEVLKILDTIYQNVDSLSHPEIKKRFPFKNHDMDISLAVLQRLYEQGKDGGMSMNDKLRNRNPRRKYRYRDVIEVVNDFRIYLFELINDVINRNKIDLPGPVQGLGSNVEVS